MGRKKSAPLALGQREWAGLCQTPASLAPLLEQSRGTDVVREMAIGLQPGGALHAAPLQLRLQVLALLETHAAELCADAPQDLVRLLFECVRDRSANPAVDGPEGTARLQLAGLHAVTTLMVKLDMPQRDARLVKVHVESLFKVMERSGPHADASPALCYAAATCLRRMEEAAPTLLLAGAKQLLDLARHETGQAAEAYVMLAARVLSHGAACCLEQSAAEAAAAGLAAEQGGRQRSKAGGGEGSQQGAAGEDGLSILSSIDMRALSLGVGAGASEASASAAVRFVSPVGTLDATALTVGITAFASRRTATSSEDFSSPKEAPGSPRGVGSVAGTASTFATNSTALSVLASQQQQQERGGSGAAGECGFASGLLAQSEISGSVQLDTSAPQPLLSADCAGLRHFRVPQYIHWPDALGHAALCVYVPPEAQQDLQQACCEFLAAMPRLSVEGVSCLTAALPPIMRLADLPPAQLQAALDSLLHSGRTLMLQAVLKLYGAVPPEGYADWQARLVDTVLLMVNGPHPAEHRVIAITWALVQHHAQMHARRASLFAGAWRQLLPRPDDPAQLLSLKIKALSACLAVGIGRAEEVCPMIFAWDGFWQPAPTDQQLRLATYALRMLGSAATSYAAACPAVVAVARQPPAGIGAGLAPAMPSRPASPHYVKACLVSASLQLLATRPQYLPAVEAFLTHCGSACTELQHTILNAVDALLSAAATGTFTCLTPPPRRAGVPVSARHSSRLASPSGSGSLSPHHQLARSHHSRSNSHSPPDQGGSGSADGSHDSPSGSGLSAVLARMKRSVSKKVQAALSSPLSSPDFGVGGSLQAAAEGGGGADLSRRSGGLEASASGSRRCGLPPIAEAAMNLAAPQPPWALQSWEEAEAWCWHSRSWTALSSNLLAHDPMAYRPLLLRLAQAGDGVLPMGTLRMLAAYASQYQGEAPGHQLSAREAGNAVLAICQAAAVSHLLIGPKGPLARSAAAGQPSEAAHASGEAAPASAPAPAPGQAGSAGSGASHGADTPQWTLQQEEIALAMQAVLSALTSHFPVESVRRRAQSFLDLLANPSAWDLRVRVGTMAKMLGGYFSDAVSAAAYM